MRNRIVQELRGHLTNAGGVDPNRLALLVPENSTCAEPVSRLTAASLRDAIGTIGAPVRPADRFIFYYTGQANVVGGQLRLNLPGPDVTDEQLAKWLAGVRAETQAIILDCPCAAVAAKALTRRGRILVLASTAEQVYATRFGAHFVPSLGRANTDANGDGKVSLLEAFTTAAREIEHWYQQMQILPTETPSIEDDGDGTPGERPWRHEVEGGDGARAAEFVLTVPDRNGSD